MSCPRQTTSQGERKSVNFKHVKQEPQHQRLSGHFGRNDRSSSYEKSLLSSLSEEQVKVLIKMQALSRGKSTRRKIAGEDSTLSEIIDERSADEESQRSTIEDLPTTESFSKDYVDKLKAKLAAESEDNKKLRAFLSEQTAPTTPHVRSGKGGMLSRGFKPFGRASMRASAATDPARTRTF